MIKSKILFVTTPIRPVPDSFPPYAILSIMKSLRKSGYNNSQFYNIDYLRPSISKAVDYIINYNPDVLAISAVVSTAYLYVKNLSIEVKKIRPDIPIICGGPLGASAEILLEKTGVDFVCISEGESVMEDFLKRISKKPIDRNYYLDVPGLVFYDNQKKLVTTGYPEQIDKKDIYDVDWNDLTEKELKHYFPIIDAENISYGGDLRSVEHFGKSLMTIPGSKDCVAKCAFCHRWDKGIRYRPVDILMEKIKECINNYNVAFIDLGDENFGTDKRWLKAFCSEVKKLNVLWKVGGMRTNCISSEQLKMMKEAGNIRILASYNVNLLNRNYA